MSSSISCINPSAAGIDVGSKSHFVAVPKDRDSQPVQEFGFFTKDLHRLAKWLKDCGIETVAFEATGSYWMPIYDVLTEYGLDVCLVNSRHTKNVSGRKSDVQDCQWIQELHSFGLLQASFIPDRLTARLRHLSRHRDQLIQEAATQLQRMQKALIEMNLQIHNIVSDIAGDTGMRIIRAIIKGERDGKKLSEYRDPRCKNSRETIEQSLVGHYKEEVLFSLSQALESYDHYQVQIAKCDKEIEKLMGEFEDKSNGSPLPEKKREAKKNQVHFDTQGCLWKMLGVNLMDIPGLNSKTALAFVSEIGPSVEHWPNAKCFASWLGLSPNNRVSGGKRLSGRTRSTANRIRIALQMAAMTLGRSQTALGSYYRRMRARLGAPKAITATAHKLAVIIYTLIKRKCKFQEAGPSYFEDAYQDRMKRRLKRLAEQFGYNLVKNGPETANTLAT